VASSKRPVGLCRLCNNRTPICNSHIISEFLYRPLYDKKHRFHQVTIDPNDRPVLHQKGIREYLLCDCCEQRFCENETYVKDVLFGGEIKFLDFDDAMILEGLDYKRFKLFQMSILWRCGISAFRDFESIQLGSQHEEKLRQMLLTEKPGEPYEYGCLLVSSPDKINEWSNTITIFADQKKLNGHHAYTFLLVGIFWTFFVSSHTRNTSIDFKKIFLSKEGQLPIFKDDGRPKAYMDKLFRQLPDLK
jgi:hypothetical protein